MVFVNLKWDTIEFVNGQVAFGILGSWKFDNWSYENRKLKKYKLGNRKLEIEHVTHDMFGYLIFISHFVCEDGHWEMMDIG